MEIGQSFIMIPFMKIGQPITKLSHFADKCLVLLKRLTNVPDSYQEETGTNQEAVT
jgi:hypothetical protein